MQLVLLVLQTKQPQPWGFHKIKEAKPRFFYSRSYYKCLAGLAVPAWIRSIRKRQSAKLTDFHHGKARESGNSHISLCHRQATRQWRRSMLKRWTLLHCKCSPRVLAFTTQDYVSLASLDSTVNRKRYWYKEAIHVTANTFHWNSKQQSETVDY